MTVDAERAQAAARVGDALERDGWAFVSERIVELGQLAAECRRRGLVLADERCDDVGVFVYAARPGTDEQTGLANWAALALALERHAGTAPLAVLCADVNGLGRLNDRHGDRAGDRAIAAVGRALAAFCRPREEAFRERGRDDAFRLLLPHVDEAEASARAAGLETTLAGVPLPGRWAGSFEGVTVAAAVRLDTQETPGEALDRGRRALRARKLLRARRR